jgi:hypothetical protein
MKTTHLLLPYTYGVVMDVLEYIDLLTMSYSVTLVPLSLCLKRDDVLLFVRRRGGILMRLSSSRRRGLLAITHLVSTGNRRLSQVLRSTSPTGCLDVGSKQAI